MPNFRNFGQLHASLVHNSDTLSIKLSDSVGLILRIGVGVSVGRDVFFFRMGQCVRGKSWFQTASVQGVAVSFCNFHFFAAEISEISY